MWHGVRYGIETTTNNLKEAEKVLNKTVHRMLNILGIESTVKKGWQHIHSTLGEFGLFSFATKQLIKILNLLM